MPIDDVASGAMNEDFLASAKITISHALRGGAGAQATEIEALSKQLIQAEGMASLRLPLLLDAVRYFYLSGQAFSGLPVAHAARQLGVETSNAPATLDALLLIGVCAAETGGIPTAMEAYADGLTLAQGIQDRVREGKIWLNLGVALGYSGLFREALACYERAVKLIEEQPVLASLRASVYCNIAQCHLHLDEIRQGLLAIEKSITSSAEPTDAHSVLNRVLAENYYTCLLLEADNYSEASEHSRRARKYAAQSMSPLVDNIAAIAEGLAEVFSGQVDVGISRLIQTLERARSLRTTTREVLKALVKAYEYVGKPDQALVYLRQMLDQQTATQKNNVFQHVKLHLEQIHPSLEDESSVIKRLATRREILEGRVAKQALFKAQVESMERMAVVAELRDDSTGAHSYRVGRLAALLAKEAGCDEETIFMIDIAARLHDIGKVGIPDGILMKPGPLNSSERDVMKNHTTIGAEVLANSNIAHMKTAEDIARFHHEWWDGTGYPNKLKGEAIPMAARITALADVFDALTHSRPYKPAWTLDTTLTEILSLRGSQFDPNLTDTFLRLMGRLRREHDNLDAYLGEAAVASPFLQARKKIHDTLQRPDDGTFRGSESRNDLQR